MTPRSRTTTQIQLCLRLPTLAAAWFCRSFRRKPVGRTDCAILVVRLDGLGDCVLTLPLLDALRRRYPCSRISVLVSPAAASLFAGHASVDEVMSMRTIRARMLPRQAQTFLAATLTWWTTLRGRQFDIAINPRWDVDVYMATFLCAMTRSAVTAGFEDGTTEFKKRLNRGFEKAWTIRVAAGPGQHEAVRNLALGHALGCDAEAAGQPRLRVLEPHRRRAEQWLGSRGDRTPLAVGLPAAEAKRRWPAESYIELLRMLERRVPVLPVLFADEATVDDAHRIREAVPHSRIARLLPLLETAAILEQCSFFVGSDSGLGHIAAAVGCATLTLSPHPTNGDAEHPNSPLRFRPYSPDAIVLQPKNARAGCERACVSSETHCIADITPAEVASAIMESGFMKDRVTLGEAYACSLAG